MKKLIFIFFTILFCSCERQPVACLSISPAKNEYKVGEEVIFDSSCASAFTYINYDFGDGDVQTIQAEKGHKQSKIYKFKGNYTTIVTYYSKTKKKTSYEERKLVVVD